MKVTGWVIVAMITFTATSCKKEKFKSKYVSLLQNKWTEKSYSTRLIINSFATQWETTQTPNLYREFTKDGMFILTMPGFTYSQPYELMKDTVILFMNPATLYMPYKDPDTAYIRKINESLFIMYTKRSFTSTFENRLHERIDSLVR